MDYDFAIKELDSRIFELEKRTIQDMDREDLESAYLDLLKRYFSVKNSLIGADEEDYSEDEDDD